MALPVQAGQLYIQPNGPNGIWTQPGGIGTIVLPQQQNGPFTNYPVPGQFFIELSGLFVAGCGHWFDYPKIFIDTGLAVSGGYGTGGYGSDGYGGGDTLITQAAAVCCPLCTYVQYWIPAAVFYDLSSDAATPITII